MELAFKWSLTPRLLTRSVALCRNSLALDNRRFFLCLDFQVLRYSTVMPTLAIQKPLWKFHYSLSNLSTSSTLDRASGEPTGEIGSSSIRGGQPQNDTENKKAEESGKKVSLFQRFKNAYKEYGKVLIGVHLATSAVWFGCFYYIARSGINIAPMLQSLGVSDNIISRVTDSAAGDLAVAYILYELTKPIRFAVTLIGTQHTVRKLRQWGYMEPRKDEDRLTALAREGQQQLKDKRIAIAENIRQRARRGRLSFRRRGFAVRGRQLDLSAQRTDVSDNAPARPGSLSSSAAASTGSRPQGSANSRADANPGGRSQ